MKCPNCHNIMGNDFCNRCGYMNNGVTINLNDKTFKASDLEVFIGDKYTNILHNKNLLLIFILGPFFFSYMKCFITGLILGVIDIIFIYMGGYLFSNLYTLIFNFLISRLFYLIFANAFYLSIMKFKLKILKSKKNYKNIIGRYKSSSIISLILTFAIYFIGILIILYTYKYYR